MGSRGPAPKRTEARIRRNGDYGEVTVGDSGVHTPAPYLADESWHPIAVEFWESLQTSGQARWYEQSDWAAAYMLCEAISREMKPQFLGQRTLPDGSTEPFAGIVPVKGTSLNAFRSWMASLLVTEGDRRRVQMELQKPAEPEEDGALAIVHEIRDALSKKTS